jgi:hypothetical protein
MIKNIKLLSKEELAVVSFVADSLYDTLIPIPFLILHPLNLFDNNVFLLEKLKGNTTYVFEGGFPNKDEDRLIFLTEVAQTIALSKYSLRIILQLLLQVIFSTLVVVCLVTL